LEMNRYLTTIQKRQFESTLSNNFDSSLKLFSGKSDTIPA